MSFLICKMCGGDLEILENSAIAECVHCRRKQTIPSQADENLQNLFNRANTLRMKGEFDKAEQIYESLIRTDGTQAEAYWGLILCKYGIEYVDDPATGKKIPTCHRASYDSIIADDDYKSALENAHFGQKWLYEEQAKEIDRIQKEILALAQKEETYDIFICYKETDENGRKTQDSVYANDIYYQLKQNGYKVFYSAITLEGKLGREYEPIIFAALNSAKVMLVIGTKNEYFKAVWVKNEWSRFLKIIKKDRSKLLIPCYRDMDAYDLPDEFLHLQAQDMSKIGFINDLIRGIEKVVRKETPKVTAQRSSAFSVNIAPLLKRVSMFLEDEDWESADEYCEKVLDQDPENAEAYLGKLMAELKVKRQSELRNCSLPFDDNLNYRKVIRFGDDALKSTLSGYIEFINNRRFNPTYLRAVETMKNASSIDSYENAMKTFECISGWKDSDKLAQECKKIIEELKIKAETDRKDKILNDAKENMKFATVLNYNTAFEMLQKIRNWKNANELIKECEKGIEQLKIKAENDRKDEILNLAKEEMKSSTVLNYDMAIELLQKIRSWKNANELIKECEKGIEQLKIKAENDHKDKILNDAKEKMCYSSIENYREAIDILKNIHGWKNADELIIKCQNSIERIHIEAENERKDKILNDAKSKMNSPTIENFQEAVVWLKQISGWKNANELIKKCEKGIEQLKIKAENDRKDKILNDAKENVNFASITSLEKLIEKLQSIADWKDSSEQIEICKAKLTERIKEKVALERKRKAKKVAPFVIVTAIIILIVLAIIFVPKIIVNSYMSKGEYAKAIKMGNISNFTIPNGVTSIDDYEFADCSQLTSITIPDSVTSIGKYAFKNCSKLTSITIPDSVTSISEDAFNGCVIESAKLPSGVISNIPKDNLKEVAITGGEIPNNAFKDCANLTNVTIENGVTSIGNSVFAGCSNLTSVTLPESVTSIGEYAFYGCSSLRSITLPSGVTSIGSYVFSDCNIEKITLPATAISGISKDKLKEVVITNGEIPYVAFYDCKNLTSVTIGNDVTSIATDAFYGCSNLKSVHISDVAKWCAIDFQSTESNPLYRAKNLYLNGNLVEELKIPDGVTSISPYAFIGCSKLISVTIPDSVTDIGSSTFENCNIERVTLPANIISKIPKDKLKEVVITSGKIPNGAFKNCKNLTSVTILDGVTSVGDSAFSDCTNLTGTTYDNAIYLGNTKNPYLYLLKPTSRNITSVNIHNKAKFVASNAFKDCSALTSVTIPNSVMSIEAYTFSGCAGLTSITIPDGVTSIGSSAFRDCTGLTSITISNSVIEIGDDAFKGCDKLIGTTYDNAIYLGNTQNPYLCLLKVIDKKITSVDIHEKVKIIYSRAFDSCSNLKNVTICDGVTHISNSAFSGCTGLTSITIPDSVTSIGDDAFHGCIRLESVTIPNSVTSIGSSAFSDCTGLTSITIPNSVTSIGSSAFSDCTGLTSIIIPDSVTSIGDYAFDGCIKLESVTIPNSVTSIGESAFRGCIGLTNITIPDSVTYIGRSAFEGCKGLTSIKIPKSVVEIGAGAFKDCSNIKSADFENKKWIVYDVVSSTTIDLSNSIDVEKYLIDTYSSRRWKFAK